MSTVLITGGSGFIGAHCIATALTAGYSVRTTLRTPSREGEVRAMVGAEASDALEVVQADLTADDGWDAAVGAATRSSMLPRRSLWRCRSTRTI
jgi:nucleoside-diphosphate-sugar epimerase